MYGDGISKAKEIEVKTRADQSLLAKIRSGHTILFAAYRNRINPDSDPTCPLCEDGIQDFVHWMTKCAGTLEHRRNLFGPEDYDRLEMLTRNPLQAIALAKLTLDVEA